MTKVCKTCGIEKDESEFHKCKNTKGGFKNSCKPCRNSENKLKWAKTPEQANRDSKKYKENHPEKVKQVFKNWYNKNRESQLKRAFEYSKTDKAKEAAKRYKSNNRDKINKWKKENLLKNPHAKIRKTLRNRFHKIITRLKKGVKNEHYLILLGCTLKEFETYVQNKFKEGMNWENHGIGTNKWTYDHIKPLSHFNLFDIEEQRIAFHYTNIQPLWGTDNFKKGDRFVG